MLSQWLTLQWYYQLMKNAFFFNWSNKIWSILIHEDETKLLFFCKHGSFYIKKHIFVYLKVKIPKCFNKQIPYNNLYFLVYCFTRICSQNVIQSIVFRNLPSMWIKFWTGNCNFDELRWRLCHFPGVSMEKVDS